MRSGAARNRAVRTRGRRLTWQAMALAASPKATHSCPSPLLPLPLLITKPLNSQQSSPSLSLRLTPASSIAKNTTWYVCPHYLTLLSLPIELYYSFRAGTTCAFVVVVLKQELGRCNVDDVLREIAFLLTIKCMHGRLHRFVDMVL